MGIYIEHEADYHARPELSRSQLWTLYTKSPFHYRFADKDEIDPAHMTRGKLAHYAVLQPEWLPKVYATAPKMNKNTNAWKELVVKAFSDGLILVDQEEMDKVLRMAEMCHRESIVREFIAASSVEESYTWADEQTGVLLRCRPDAYNGKLALMGDYKTTRDASPRAFARSVASYGYHLQEAVYMDGIRRNGLPVEGTIFIAQESSAPFAVQVYELSPDATGTGQAIYREALARFKACEDADSWPAYGGGVQTLELPAWAMEREDDGSQAEE